jgi:hypothetical protein
VAPPQDEVAAPDWGSVKALLGEALEAAPGARPDLVRRRAGEDAALAAEVLSLLGHLEDAPSFLEPAGAPATGFLRSLRADLPSLASLGGRDGPPPFAVGSSLEGRFRLDAVLGGGAHGAVYRAADLLEDRPVAVKVLRELRGRSVETFRRETAILRIVRVPGVVGLLDDGQERGRPFVVMDLVEGVPFPGPGRVGVWAALAPVVRGVLEALAGLHELGLVHRDLKPANCLVDPSGTPTIVDLGLAEDPDASPTRGPVAGTPAYMAPEQFRGVPPDPRSDLYSLGVMLHEALSGGPPHAARRMEELEGMRRQPPPTLHGTPGIPAVVADLVAALLDPDPARRPASARACLARLDGAGGDRDPLSDELRRRVAALPAGPAGAPDERTLRRLFRGPDLLLHLREDAASELVRRAGSGAGVEAFARQLRDWVRAGRARVEPDLLVLERGSLDRMQEEPDPLPARADGAPAGPADHAAAAAALAPGSHGRWWHLVRAGDAAGAVPDLHRIAARRLAEGRMGLAATLGMEALSILRRRGGEATPEAEPFLPILVEGALLSGVVGTWKRSLHAVEILEGPTPRVRDAGTVLRSGILAGQDRRRAEAALLAREPGPGNPLRRWWLAVFAFLARCDHRGEQVRILRQVLARCRGDRDPEIRAALWGWIANVRYKRSQYETMCRDLRRGAQRAPTPRQRARLLSELAGVLLQRGRAGEAVGVVERLHREHPDSRGTAWEAYLVLVGGTAAAVAGRDEVALAEDLVQLIALREFPSVVTTLVLDLCSSFRAQGRTEEMANLAASFARSVSLHDHPGTKSLVEALASRAAGGAGGVDTALRLLREAHGNPLPGLGWQTLALAAEALAAKGVAAPRVRLPDLAFLSPPHGTMEREVLSPVESLRVYLGALGPGDAAAVAAEAGVPWPESGCDAGGSAGTPGQGGMGE